MKAHGHVAPKWHVAEVTEQWYKLLQCIRQNSKMYFSSSEERVKQRCKQAGNKFASVRAGYFVLFLVTFESNNAKEEEPVSLLDAGK